MYICHLLEFSFRKSQRRCLAGSTACAKVEWSSYTFLVCETAAFRGGSSQAVHSCARLYNQDQLSGFKQAFEWCTQPPIHLTGRQLKGPYLQSLASALGARGPVMALATNMQMAKKYYFKICIQTANRDRNEVRYF
jgi:hypothetical protein